MNKSAFKNLALCPKALENLEIVKNLDEPIVESFLRKLGSLSGYCFSFTMMLFHPGIPMIFSRSNLGSIKRNLSRLREETS